MPVSETQVEIALQKLLWKSTAANRTHMRAALEAALSDAPAPEPVAWRYRHPLNPNLWVVVSGPDWPERDKDMEPLYAAPPATGR